MQQIDESHAATSAEEAPDVVPLPLAPRSGHVKNVSIRARQVVPPNQREVWLYYAENGKRVRRTMTVGRPTVFEELVVAVVNEISTLPPPAMLWPTTPREGAKAALSQLRYARSSLLSPLRAEQALYDVRSQEPNNMAHLLLEILPLVLFAQDALDSKMTTVFREVRGPFRELLDVLEVNAMFTSRRLAGPMVRVRGTRGLAAYDMLGMFDVPSMTVLPNTYDRFSFKGSKQAEKIQPGAARRARLAHSCRGRARACRARLRDHLHGGLQCARAARDRRPGRTRGRDPRRRDGDPGDEPQHRIGGRVLAAARLPPALSRVFERQGQALRAAYARVRRGRRRTAAGTRCSLIKMRRSP